MRLVTRVTALTAEIGVTEVVVQQETLWLNRDAPFDKASIASSNRPCSSSTRAKVVVDLKCIWLRLECDPIERFRFVKLASFVILFGLFKWGRP